MIPLLMFGFGFALVPLYDVFCDITGLNGKTGRVEASEIDAGLVDTSLTNHRSAFPGEYQYGFALEFRATGQEAVEVHPGQVYEADISGSAVPATRKTLGQAVPSVSPGLAAQHFNKTECFCFTQQELEAAI